MNKYFQIKTVPDRAPYNKTKLENAKFDIHFKLNNINKKGIKMNEEKQKEESSGYTFGEMILLAATGIIPGMIILWVYKNYIKSK